MDSAVHQPGSGSLRRRLIVWFGRFHAWIYERSDGRIGARLKGQPMALVWTTGRRSGEIRRTPLLCRSRGDDIVVVGSFYGAAKHPAWVLNLRADPRCTVRYGRSRYAGVAREATGDERSALWAELTAQWPSYAEYQERTTRLIPVVILSPEDPAGGARVTGGRP